MKKSARVIISILLITYFTSCSGKEVSLQKGYLNESPPSFIPQLFGSHLATENDNRHSKLTFSLKGDELYYSVYVNNTGPQKIFFSKQVNGIWTRPAIASFSGKYKDGCPLFSPDGNRIYFYSKRPLPPDTVKNIDYNIWYVERRDTDWSEPVHLDKHINTDRNENLYTFTKNGDLYFERDTEDNKHFLLKSKFVNGAYQKPVIIKELSNQGSFSEPVRIEGEDYFIYTNNVQKGEFYYAELLISHKNNDGSWTSPKDMGDMINYGEGRFPSISPDGKYFFFLSYRSGISQYYWVDAKVIDYLKTENLDLINQLKTIMIDKDLIAMKSAYNLLTQKHADYYRFDDILFNEIASELIAIDLYQKAIDVYKLNFELYPQQKFYVQKLTVSLLDKDENVFNKISTLLVTEISKTKQNLHDDLNVAGEIFLRKNRTTEAIKIFRLNAEINPTSTWPFYKLGKAYYKMEDKKLAEEYFTMAIKLDSSNVYAENYLKKLNSGN